MGLFCSWSLVDLCSEGCEEDERDVQINQNTDPIFNRLGGANFLNFFRKTG